MTDQKLLPCPFCGCKKIIIKTHIGCGRCGIHSDEDIYSIGCWECGASVPSRYKRELVKELWNRRV